LTISSAGDNLLNIEYRRREMAYLVTGGTGFIGSRIVRDLVRGGEQVVAYDLFPEVSILELLLSEEERTRVKIVRGDITDLPYLIHAVRENGVEKIIHMASLLSDVAGANPPLSLKVMAEGTLNVFEAARILGLKKVVWVSSTALFGSREKYGDEPIPNDAPHYPMGVYGACKSFSENMAVHYFDQYGVDILALRYTLVYGAEQVRGGSGAVVRELILKPAVGEPGIVPHGDDTLNWLYVDDAARATVLAAKAPGTETRSFNTSGDIRPIREVAEYVCTLLPGADITLLPGVMGVGWRFDTTLIEEELGFSPQWSMEQGVKDIINITRKQHGLPPV